MKSINIKSLILFYCSVFIFNIAYSEWTIQNSKVQVTLNSVCFVDSLHGWIAGDSGIILFTKNGGKDWSKQSSGFAKKLNSISFSDTNNGWVVGSGGLILTTSNGGNSWVRVIHDTVNSVRHQKVKCFSPNEIIILRDQWYGDYYGGSRMWKTSNSGIEWIEITPASSLYILDFEFHSINNGWIVNRETISLTIGLSKTINGGNNWSRILLTPFQNSGESKIVFSDTLNGWVTDGYWLYNYVDSIKSFKLVGNYGFFGIRSVCRIGSVGYVSSYGSIMKSSDSGKQWIKQPILDGVNILSINFINPRIGWCVGSNGFIASTLNGGISYIDQKYSIDLEYKLNQNYPNPFNPSTKICIELLNPSIVSVVIYNMHGQEIEVLVNRKLLSGSTTVVWTPNNISSGIYFYKLITTSFISVKKMVYIK